MDRIESVLTDLLACAEERLSLKVCKSFIHAGPNAPWDTCESAIVDGEIVSGQVWVANTLVTPDWPQSSGMPKPCPTSWTAEIEVGVTRCASARLRDDGSAPSGDEITSDAVQQQIDRFELMSAIVCCLQIEDRDLVFDRWEPFEPSGGCIASRWVFRVRIDACGCR